LAAKLKVLGVLHTIVKPHPLPGGLRAVRSTGPKPMALIVEYEGRRYIVDLEQSITDEGGTPLPALAGYRLLSIARSYAVFSREDADLVLKLDAK
jgi:hypothetical protein